MMQSTNSVKNSAIIERSGEMPHDSAYVAPSSSNTYTTTPNNVKVEELEKTLQRQNDRIAELEAALRDSRKGITQRENILHSLQQWEPKDLFYLHVKDTKITDKTVRESQDSKLKVLLDQMKVMEIALENKDKQLSSSLAMSQGMGREASFVSSPKFGTPKLNGSRSPKTPKWSASGVASPSGSPKVKRSGSWWNFGGAGGRKSSLSPDSIGNSPLGSPLGSSPVRQSSSRAKTTLVV